MILESARSLLEARLAEFGASLTPRHAATAMISFYAEERCEGCDLKKDGDMLLYQWGTYEVYDPEDELSADAELPAEGEDEPPEVERFQMDFSRQFIIADGEEDAMWQLSLTLLYQPTKANARHREGEKWCESPLKAASFQKTLDKNLAFIAMADVPCESRQLCFVQV